MKTMLVECKLPDSQSRMDEVADMAKTLDYEVVEEVVQNRERVDGAYCVGTGKITEIEHLVEEKSIKAIIFTRTLSSGQVFRIQKRLGEQVKVIDRNLLILEVFEKRAATSEAKQQIELARLRYTFSRGRESIRTRGIVGEQMGRGGPGNYPYEAYEAMARKRISKIEDQLRRSRGKKETLRENRRETGFPIVALTGYTQSGKTTFFNRVASESKSTGLGPFTTLSTCARKVTYPSKGKMQAEFIIIDSIGLIEDLHPTLLKAFHTTLGEIADSDLILLFVDANDDLPTITRKVEVAKKIIKEKAPDIPIIVCANKIDLTMNEHLKQVTELLRSMYGFHVREMSSKTGDKLDTLLEAVHDAITKSRGSALPNRNLIGKP
jgi:GTP-binding protein HflX